MGFSTSSLPPTLAPQHMGGSLSPAPILAQGFASRTPAFVVGTRDPAAPGSLGGKPSDTVKTRKEGDVRLIKIAFCPEQSLNSLEQLARQAHEVASKTEQGDFEGGCIPVKQSLGEATQTCRSAQFSVFEAHTFLTPTSWHFCSEKLYIYTTRTINNWLV